MHHSKILAITAIILTSSSVFAFGGGGKSKMFDEEWMQGVDAFRMHFGGNGQVDIKFKCDDPNATPNNKGVCNCKKGYKKENDVCVTDACANFKKTDCITACTSSNGVASYTYPTTCLDGWLCTTDTHECVNPCYERDCQTCTPNNGEQSWTFWDDKISCSTGWCQSGECENACKDKTWDEECQTCNIHTGIITPSQTDDTPCSKGSCQGGICTNMCADKTWGECQQCDSATGIVTPITQHTECSSGYCFGDSCVQCVIDDDCPDNTYCKNNDCTSPCPLLGEEDYDPCTNYDSSNHNHSCISTPKAEKDVCYYVQQNTTVQGSCITINDKLTCNNIQGRDCSSTNPCPGDYGCNPEGKCTSLGRVMTKEIDDLGYIAHSDNITSYEWANEWCNALNHATKPGVAKPENTTWKILSLNANSLLCYNGDNEISTPMAPPYYCCTEGESSCTDTDDKSAIWQDLADSENDWLSFQVGGTQATLQYFWTAKSGSTYPIIDIAGTTQDIINADTTDQDKRSRMAALCILCGLSCVEGEYHPSSDPDNCICRSCEYATESDCSKCNGYTYSEEYGCHPSCSEENYEFCNEQECNGLGNGYTYSEENGCQEAEEPAECSTENYSECDQQGCSTLGDGYTYDNRGCHPRCSEENYEFCNEQECNGLGNGYTYSEENGCQEAEEPAECSTENYSECDQQGCTALGEGYSYDEEDGCHPSCSEQHYHFCDEQGCNGLGDGYTFSEQYGCQGIHDITECSTENYGFCDQEGCSTLGDGYTYDDRGCHPLCSEDNFSFCTFDQCNQLGGAHGFAYIGDSCESCQYTPEACVETHCKELGYIWTMDDLDPNKGQCRACAADTDCDCCQSCGQDPLDINTYGRCHADANSTRACEIPNGHRQCSDNSYVCDYSYKFKNGSCVDCSEFSSTYANGWWWSDNQNTCLPLCTSDEQCEAWEGDGFMCSSEHLCVKKCTTSDDCTEAGTICDTTKGMCVGCTSNEQCPDNQYCHLEPNMDDAEHGYAPVDGTCQDIASFYDINTNSLGSVRVGIGDEDLHPDIMNWWAADNWCKAQGKNLINIAAFECYYDSDTQIVEGDNHGGRCCAQGQNCMTFGSYSSVVLDVFNTIWNNFPALSQKNIKVWTASTTSAPQFDSPNSYGAFRIDMSSTHTPTVYPVGRWAEDENNETLILCQ